MDTRGDLAQLLYMQLPHLPEISLTSKSKKIPGYKTFGLLKNENLDAFNEQLKDIQSDCAHWLVGRNAAVGSCQVVHLGWTS